MIIKVDGVSYIRHSALFEIEINPLILCPFNNGMIPIHLRKLNYAQIKSCGDFSLIEAASDLLAGKRKVTDGEMLNYAETQNKIIKTALVSPSYDELMEINDMDPLRKNTKKELIEIEKIMNDMDPGPKKSRMKNKMNTIKLQLATGLPANFITWVVSYALGTSDSDINIVTLDMLFESATLAKLGNDNPCDHLTGNFTDFNKEDINNRAWIEYFKRTKKDK